KHHSQLLVENLEAIAKIHSYYLANNKSELSYYGQDHLADEIHQILKMADLYDEEEDIDLDQIMLNVNLERSNIDDDIGDETDVKNPQEDNNELDEWIVNLEQEENYDPKTVVNLFVNQE
ncbi:11188_t:CDS:2, partial [Ambispora leptoticha]